MPTDDLDDLLLQGLGKALAAPPALDPAVAQRVRELAGVALDQGATRPARVARVAARCLASAAVVGVVTSYLAWAANVLSGLGH